MPLAQPHQILAQKLLFQRWKLPNKVFPPGAVTAKTPLSDEIANITVFISTRRDSTAAWIPISTTISPSLGRASALIKYVSVSRAEIRLIESGNEEGRNSSSFTL
jgi:hypothetical protein